ncbi:hypothetical protein [Paenibacillus woosongensis]|uniref:hypothetical protein n=1 Tax=Paenibacillus woosongensis TaxID=307580 RepID=UPI003D31815A
MQDRKLSFTRTHWEDEAREAFTKLAEGGKVKYPLEPAFWGTLHGQLEDKFGVLWMISNEVKSN